MSVNKGAVINMREEDKGESKTPLIYVELIAVIDKEEIVTGKDGDIACERIEDIWDAKVNKTGDDLLKLKFSDIEQIQRHKFYLKVSVTVRRLITIRDGYISVKLCELLTKINEFEREYKGTVIINRYWLGSEEK